MKSPTRRRTGGMLALLLAILVVAACTRTVSGVATLAEGGVKKDAPPSDLTIENGDGSEIDQLVANSMDDVMTYWEGVFEKTFGEEMQPLQGGIWAYEPGHNEALPCVPANQVEIVENNAFYCPSEDAIAYDRAFLGQLADEFGEFIVPLVFAHEFGHAIQDRVGDPGSKTISWEGQADCYAGVFTKQATDGTTHFKATSEDLDSVLTGYLMLRSQPGGSPDDPNAHGSAFDRVAAFQEGFNDGPDHCYTAFDDDRVYTQIPYLTANDKANAGNLPYDQTLQTIPTEMNTVGETVVGSSWEQVDASGFDGSSAKCDGDPQDELVFYCPDDKTVHYAEKGLISQAYDKFGDFAAMTLISMGYADAILDAEGAKTDGKDAFEAQLCFVGAYSGGAFEASATGEQSPLGGLQLSAGDLDEAVMVLIALGEDNAILDTHGLDAFDRIDVFREGFEAGRDDPLKAAQNCL